jgi:hypothetical protein
MRITIDVNGIFPIDPARSTNVIVCRLDLSAPHAAYGEWTPDVEYRDGDPPIVWDLPLGDLSPMHIGTNSWVVECKSLYYKPEWYERDSGTIEITA